MAMAYLEVMNSSKKEFSCIDHEPPVWRKSTQDLLCSLLEDQNESAREMVSLH